MSESNRHGIETIPPAYVMPPRNVDAQIGEDVPWWKPSLREIAAHLGWRWFYFVPAALLVVWLILLMFRPEYFHFVLIFAKLILVAVGMPTMMAISAVKHIVQNRSEPFCIHCGYTLLGLPDGHRCPECGRKFSFDAIAEYRRDPQCFVKRWKTMRTSLSARDVAFDTTNFRRKSSERT